MTLAQVRHYARAVNRLEAQELKAQAIAIRAGMSEERGFKQWIKSLDG